MMALLVACGPDRPALTPTNRGYYVVGHQLNSFRPCNRLELYYVEGPGAKTMEERYYQLSRRPFQAVYVELRGQLQPADMGMDAHGGRIRVDTLLKAALDRPKDCKLPDRPDAP